MAKDRGQTEELTFKNCGIVDAVHRMEPELQHLAGVLATLQIFGEAGDSIEPVALAALARSMEGSIDELTICWRQLFEAVAKESRTEATA
ncbi:hypothetical protein ASD64_19150 [Mesorhizobium sp. Root157]|uniref:hypothetical protein n=1 Tax=Mesorhizobium sp. Root157 TaxID=1736477 RepID=UPI0006FEAC5A|nr:hypothetical protein [Mesorhizobium sp. Root157]KQZ93245.1 hypothetical protein ASD64_19150 [Mesorhizobium sp. Root157]